MQLHTYVVIAFVHIAGTAQWDISLLRGGNLSFEIFTFQMLKNH